MNGIRAIGVGLVLFGFVLLGYSDYTGLLLLFLGIPLIFYDLVAYYIKLKIFFKLNNANKSEATNYQATAPRVRKPRRPKIK